MTHNKVFVVSAENAEEIMRMANREFARLGPNWDIVSSVTTGCDLPHGRPGLVFTALIRFGHFRNGLWLIKNLNFRKKYKSEILSAMAACNVENLKTLTEYADLKKDLLEKPGFTDAHLKEVERWLEVQGLRMKS